MASKNRIYFVIDMKSFFASVECAERGLNPYDTPLVVADKERTEASICLAVSPKMKELGVKNRCRLFEIPPHLKYIIAKPRMKKYIEYASEIYAIYLKYIDKSDIYVYSIDECFIDVTDYLKIYKTTPVGFAQKLMNEIWNTLGIPATTGIGTNMYLAKIALDITAKHKPNHIGFLTEELFEKTLSHHTPLTDFWGISKGISERLKRLGITDMHGIAHYDEEVLYREFGVNAELLIDHAKGIEPCTMADIKAYSPKSKSMSSSQILACNYSYIDAKIVLLEMIQNGCYDLFREGVVTGLIHIFVVYGDNREDGAKSTIRMPIVTNLYSQIEKYISPAYDKMVDRTRPIRKVGYDFAELLPEKYESYDLFSNFDEISKQKKLTKSILQIQDTFGKNSLLKGIDLMDKATQKERNSLIGGHRSE